MRKTQSHVIHHAGTRQEIEDVLAQRAGDASDSLYRDLALHRLKRIVATPEVVRRKQRLARVLDQLDPVEPVEVIRVKIFGKARVMYVLARNKTVLGWYEDHPD